MPIPEVDLGARLLVYGGLFVAIPLSFVLLVRLVDRLALDRYVEQYESVAPDTSQGGGAPVPGAVDDEVCTHCGEHNESGFTFCRSCAARITA